MQREEMSEMEALLEVLESKKWRTQGNVSSQLKRALPQDNARFCLNGAGASSGKLGEMLLWLSESSVVIAWRRAEL